MWKQTLTASDRENLPHQEFIELDDGVTHYEVEGPQDGRPVVLVHGLTTPMFIWDYQVNHLAERGYKVVRYDLFGRGLSDRPRKRYTADFYLSQLYQLVERLNLESSVTLVGLSLGGAIATVFTAEYPSLVDKLALIAPAGLPDRMPPWFYGFIIPGLTEALCYTLGDWYYLNYGPANLTSDTDRQDEAKRHLERQLQFNGFYRAVISTLRYGPVYGMVGTYKKVGAQNIPVKAVWSRSDSVVPYHLNARLREAVPQATVDTLSSGEHTVNYDRPDEVNELLFDFLNRKSLD